MAVVSAFALKESLSVFCEVSVHYVRGVQKWSLLHLEISSWDPLLRFTSKYFFGACFSQLHFNGFSFTSKIFSSTGFSSFTSSFRFTAKIFFSSPDFSASLLASLQNCFLLPLLQVLIELLWCILAVPVVSHTDWLAKQCQLVIVFQYSCGHNNFT